MLLHNLNQNKRKIYTPLRIRAEIYEIKDVHLALPSHLFKLRYFSFQCYSHT